MIVPKTEKEDIALREELVKFFSETCYKQSMTPYDGTKANKARHRELREMVDVVSIHQYVNSWGNPEEKVCYGCYIPCGNDVDVIRVFIYSFG